jgi:replicative DNA helicase
VTTIESDAGVVGQDGPGLAEQAFDLTAPPRNLDAEAAVLGSVLKRGHALADVLPFLKPQHFYKTQHRHIYAAMAALFDRAAAIDYYTLTEELRHQGTYDDAGGLLYLSELDLATPSAAYIDY